MADDRTLDDLAFRILAARVQDFSHGLRDFAPRVFADRAEKEVFEFVRGRGGVRALLQSVSENERIQLRDVVNMYLKGGYFRFSDT